MQENTKKTKRLAPIVCALVAVALLGLLLAILVYPLLWASYGDIIAVIFLAVYALIIVAIIGGILAAMVQRLREIEGGEEEDARKY